MLHHWVCDPSCVSHPGQPGVLRRFFATGPIQGISSRGGCYLAMRFLPLNITKAERKKEV
jgi:hypothetical protein